MMPNPRNFLLTIFVLLGGCQPDIANDLGGAPEHTAMSTNRIAIPPLVRQNLGITFIRPERRRVAATIRMPGQFQQIPGTRHEYHTPFAGRVEPAVAHLQVVTKGMVLYHIDAPAWRQAQRELSELMAIISVTQARKDSMQPLREAHERHEQSLRAALEITAARLLVLDDLQKDIGGQANELAAVRLKQAELRAQLAEVEEKDVELSASAIELDASLAAAKERSRLMLSSAAAMTGMPEAQLGIKGDGADGVPAWRDLVQLSVYATANGVVDELAVANGAHLNDGGLVLSVRDPLQLRFQARGLQSDLPRLREGQPVRILLASRSTSLIESATFATGTLRFDASADPLMRSIELFGQLAQVPESAREGIAGFLEVETESSSASGLAIPSACIMTDGLQRVLFRRDPKNPDQVIRCEADLGIDDGRWTDQKSGLNDNDEIVLAGAYELMLASSGAAQKSGHFHSDGTFHQEAGK